MIIDLEKIKKNIKHRLLPIIIQDDLESLFNFEEALAQKMLVKGVLEIKKNVKNINKIKRGIVFSKEVTSFSNENIHVITVADTVNDKELSKCIEIISAKENKLLDLELGNYFFKNLMLSFNFFQKKIEMDFVANNDQDDLEMKSISVDYYNIIDGLTGTMSMLPLENRQYPIDLLDSKAVKYFEKIELLGVGQLTTYLFGEIKNRDNVFVIPYSQNGQQVYLLLVFAEEFSRNRNLLIYLISMTIYNLLSVNDYLYERKKDFLGVEEKFNLISAPLAIISADGELLLHNSPFLKLNILPNKCLALEDNSSMEINNEIYEVVKRSFDFGDGFSETEEKVYRILFIKSDFFETKKINQISSKEMGVITSSLAHELNNPIAGILATIEMLLMEEYWGETEKTQLKEMKNSAQRCKQLINVFLGFSRAQATFPQDSILEEAFREALSLLRFRMIESNIILDIRFEAGEKFIYNFNISLVSMIVYMILSEIITSTSQYDLIAPAPKGGEESGNIIVSGKNIRIFGMLIQTKESATLILDSRLRPTAKILKSKLLQYLLETAQLSVSVLENKILFSGLK